MALIESIKTLLGGASSAIAKLREAEAALRARLSALDQEEGRLLALPAPPDEVERNLEALIPSLGQRWTEAHGTDLVRTAGGRIERGVGPAHQRAPDAVIPGQLPDVVAGPLTLDALAAICPDVVLDGLRHVVAATTYESGPALSARLKRLAAIEEERQALQQRHAELVDEAAAGGLSIAHLPEEVARRMRAAERHRAWELDMAMNRAYYERNPGTRPAEPPTR